MNAQVEESVTHIGKSIVENFYDPALWVSAELEVTWANSDFCIVFGVSEKGLSELLGKNIQELVLVQKNHFTDLMMKIDNVPVSFNDIVKSGVLLEILPFVQESKVSYFVVCKNIKVPSENLSVDSHNEALNRFARGIAHDFNNILTSMTVNHFMAKAEIGDNEEALMFIENAEEAAVKAAKLTSILSMYSTDGDIAVSRLTINKLLDNSVNEKLKTTSVNSTIEIPPNIWDIFINWGLMDQVINNIIENSLESIGPYKEGSISISCSNFDLNGKMSLKEYRKLFFDHLTPGRYVKVTIKDSAVGFSREVGDKVFDPYYSTKGSGRGLGLAASFAILKHHKGLLFVEYDERDVGALSLVIPAAISVEEGDEHDVQAKTLKILVIESDKDVKSCFESILLNLGHITKSFQGGEEGIRDLQEQKNLSSSYDVVFVNLNVKGDKGPLNTLAALKEIDSAVSVVITSGSPNNDIVLNYKDYGFDGALGKPFNISEIDTLLKSI